MANVDDDFVSNDSDNVTFADVVAARMSRRSVVSDGLSAAAFAGAGARCSSASSTRVRRRAGANDPADPKPL
jgi:secreted PhoX family phosphatase